MQITAFQLAERFIGLKEVQGTVNNPHVVAMLKLDSPWPENDEVPWCSAFVNYVSWLLRLPRSKSLLARSWLRVGSLVAPSQARVGYDLVVLTRSGATMDPDDPEYYRAPGHVGFFAGIDTTHNRVLILGGNQNNAVNVTSYPLERVLGIRRLHEDFILEAV